MSVTIIENTNKSKEINQDLHRSIGHLFLKNFILYGEKRCRVCGQWFTWKGDDIRRTLVKHQVKFLEPWECCAPNVVYRQRHNQKRCIDYMHERAKVRKTKGLPV